MQLVFDNSPESACHPVYIFPSNVASFIASFMAAAISSSGVLVTYSWTSGLALSSPSIAAVHRLYADLITASPIVIGQDRNR